MGISSRNPATGELLKSFDELDSTLIEGKLERAALAFSRHRRTSMDERARLMRRTAEIIEEEKEQLARLMTLEMGKPIRAAIAEAEKCAAVCHYYAENAARFLADESVEAGKQSSLIRYQPLGIVLAIMPWNFPFWQAFRFIAPGLMAGNVGLLKHASNVPQCALAIEDVLTRAGFSNGEFQTLLVGSAAVERLIRDPRISAVTLTGSEQAGSAVARVAGECLKKTVLELGGSDPFIVMASANVELAAATAVTARTINNGQSCIAAKRFIIEESVYDEFEQHFTDGMRALRVGDPLHPATEIGPLATESIRDELHEQVQEQEPVRRAPRLVTGGSMMDGNGWFYEPTVLADIPADSPAHRDELFGPVAALFRVADIDEAIRVANDSVFGLGSAAWTEDAAEQRRFSDEIEAGLVFINGMVASDPRLPFGGVKRSGYGRELGRVGIHEFVNIKTVVVEAAQPAESPGAEPAE
jgi:succinate-semialdehyde dehydrogenase / glutarate-semialdehyde dehydrogenase